MEKETEVIKADIKNPIQIDFSKGISNFFLKTLIVTVSIAILISFVIEAIPKIPENQRNKLIFVSFIQNPYILWELASIEEKKGNIDKATILIQAAIGIMEMHGASDKALKKYQDRLEQLGSN